ncbi:MAG: excisionase family DNA binding protein [Paraglaciecola sp.]|jgi:excisionase family DNA binding protein
MEIKKFCHLCGKDFIAQRIATKYCGDVCSKRAYKIRKRKEQIEAANQKALKKKVQPIEVLNQKEFLTAKEVAALLNISVRTVYYQIESGQIKGINLGERMTRVRRSDIDKLFEQTKKPQPELIEYEIADCYTRAEIIDQYGVSDRTLYEMIKRNGIPTIKDGWFVYVPKAEIHKHLGEPQ